MNKLVKKLLSALGILLFSPVIVFGLLCGAVVMLFDWLKEPSRKKEYKQSRYYKDFQVPYRKGIIYEDGYQFYNKARSDNLSINMVHPSNGGPDYLIIRGSVFLFPMCQDVFYGITYNTKKQHWEVNFDGEYFSLDDEWEKHKIAIADSERGSPCYLLMKQSEVCPCRNDDEEFSDDFALDLLPPYVRVVQQYIDIIPG